MKPFLVLVSRVFDFSQWAFLSRRFVSAFFMSWSVVS